jgi:hypothetical protein
MDSQAQTFTEEEKIATIKEAIATAEGWRLLAASVGDNPVARTKCIDLLRKIGDESVATSSIFLPLENGQPTANLADSLVRLLDRYLQELGGKDASVSEKAE